MKRTVLLVEDDEAFAHALVERLRREQIETRVAVSVSEAVEEVATAAPELALVDYQLPDGTGVDLIRRRLAHGAAGPAPGSSWWRARSTRPRAAGRGLAWRWIAPRWRPAWSGASCSATRAARSRARSGAGPGWSTPLPAAR